MKRMDFKLENVPHVVSACIVMHNMCELYGDNCLEEWSDCSSTTDTTTPSPTASSMTSNEASDIREAIMQHLSSM